MHGMIVVSSKVVNRSNEAVLNPTIMSEAKCAHMVERNRGMVREGASETSHKRREDTSRESEDVIFLGDENDPRGVNPAAVD